MAWWMIPAGIGLSLGSSFLGRMFGRKPRQPTVIPNLLPTPKVQVPQISHVSSEDQSGTLTYAWGGMMDSVAPGLPIPILGGKCRVGLQLINAYLRATTQQDEAFALFAVCEGEVSEVVYDQDEEHIWVTEDLKLIETDGEWEERTGTKAQTVTTWFKEIHQVHDVNIEMLEPVRIVCHFDDDNSADSKFDNQALSPGTTKKFVTTHGNVEDDTVTKKFGAASAKFPGNAGDYISVAYAAGEFSVAYNDFTMDVWLHMDTAATWKWYTICKWHNVAENTYGWAIGLATDATTASTWRIELRMGAGGLTSSLFARSVTFTGSNATWYHLAVARYGYRVRIYWDGVDITDYTYLSATGYINAASGTPDFMIGLAYSCASLSTQDMTNWFGHMDDFRFVNGKALYTHEFTPPTAAIDKYWSIPAFTTKGDCEAVTMTFSFPSGIYSGGSSTYLALRAYFRDTVWAAGQWGGMHGNDTPGWNYAFPELRFWGSMDSNLKRQTTWEFLCIRYDNRSSASLFTIGETITGGTSGAKALVCYDYDLGSNTGVLYIGMSMFATDVSALLFVENEQITGGTSGRTADVDAVPAGTDPVTTGKATYRNKSKYEFQFHRLTFDYPGVSRYGILTTIDEILYYGLRHPHTALLALRYPFLGSGARLNQIGPVSVLADRGSQSLPTWPSGTASRATSIPAWFALDVLTNTRWGRSLDITALDQTSWEAWETHTEGAVGSEKRARWNGILDSRMDIDDAVALICRAGRARITKIGGTRYVALEKTGTASHLFTAGNMIIGSYVRKDMRGDQKPHGYKIWYLDEEKEYRRKEYLYKGPDYETTLEPLRVTEEFIVGITKQDEAKRLAILGYQLTTFPNSQCVFSAGVDAVSVLPGDIAKVIPDTPYSIGGRVVDADTDRVLIDRDCSDPTGATTKMTPWGNYLQLVYRDSATDTIYTEDVEVELDTNPAPQLYHPLPDMRPYGNDIASGNNTHKTYANYVFEGVGNPELAPTNNCTDPLNDADATTGWGAYSAAVLSSQANGEGGYCLRVAADGEANPYAGKTLGILGNVGMTYRLSFRVRAGTTDQYRAVVFFGGTADPDREPDIGTQTATADWVTHTYDFTISAGADFSSLALFSMAAAASGLYVEFDDVSVRHADNAAVTVQAEFYDINFADEVEVLFNGHVIDNAALTGNNQWGETETFLIPAAFVKDTGINYLQFACTYNRDSGMNYGWAVRNVSILSHSVRAGTLLKKATYTWTVNPAKYDVYAVCHKGLVGHAGAYTTEYRVLEMERSQDLTFKLSCIEYSHDAYFHADYGATEI